MINKFKLKSKIFGVYAITIFLLCVLFAIIGVIFLPSLKLRRRWVKKFANLVFVLSGIKVKTNGLENIPDSHAIVVANHASYIDGIILHAVLPIKFTFVIKSEMKTVLLANFLFSRVGSRYVERFKRRGTFRDARKLIKAGADGESLAIFAEGTFTEEPGLHPFRMGAFLTAKKSKIPLIPTVIRGSRDILAADKFLPSRGNIEVKILEAVHQDDTVYRTGRELRDICRERILENLGEPDLQE
tara:strand:- start:51776 stop:52504 length:729 start_codon:yes stop_codon:yes gene_type:complete